MATDLALLAGGAVLYLLVLISIAELTERGHISSRVARHPAVFALSLGVYATSWTLYGSVGFADRRGFDFLAIYLGPALVCLLIPLVWLPLSRLTRSLQLASLADVFAYRYQSQAVAVVVTLFMVVGSLPYFSLQIRAVAEAAAYFSPGVSKQVIGLFFCALVLVFALLFGTRHHRIREPRPGLVVAIAFESVVKLLALLLVGAVAYFDVLGGSDGVQAWLSTHPQALHDLTEPVNEAPWVTFLLLSGCAAFLLPRQFHMAFSERPSERALLHATWLFPLLLLLLNVGIVPILWAGRQLAPGLEPDLYVLVVAKAYPVIFGIAFLGGFSASSAMVIVSSIALAGMLLNHLVTPVWRPRGDVYAGLTRARRLLVAMLIGAGWLTYVVLSPSGGLVQLGLVSFVAVAQLVPAMFGVLFWPRATRTGVMAGLAAGITVWFAVLVLPALGQPGLLEALLDLAAQVDPSWRDRWVASTTASLLLNSALFVIVSLTTRARPEEEEAAAVCGRDVYARALYARFESVGEVERHLATVLGEVVAHSEVDQALRELALDRQADHPAMISQLAERLERNLSGLIGPLPARAVVRSAQRMQTARTVLAEQVRLLEAQLDGTRLSGTAARIDVARRYLKQVLEDLPAAVCVVDDGAHVVLWNQRMATMTGLSQDSCSGRAVDELEAPWGPFLLDLLASAHHQSEEHEILHQGHRVVVRVDRTDLGGGGDSEGAVLVLEDLTERRALESKVAHQNRLASIGQLAAGVAHEIGNPLTGIVMLASNLRRERLSEDVDERLGLLISEAQRIQNIVGNLVDFSHGGSLGDGVKVELGPIAIAPVVQEACGLLRLSHRHHGVGLNVEVDGALMVMGDRQRLIQVFLNLLANACDASAAGGQIYVRSRGALGGEVQVDVLDEGAGIAPEDLPRLFDPFYTTKPVAEGTGLGLTVVFSIIRAHGGRIEAQSMLGQGTTMQVFLPTPVEGVAS